MVSNPSFRRPSSTEPERVSLRDAMGATVFIISWVITLISLVQDSVSFSTSSLLMSLRAIILAVALPVSVSDALIETVIRDVSL